MLECEIKIYLREPWRTRSRERGIWAPLAAGQNGSSSLLQRSRRLGPGPGGLPVISNTPTPRSKNQEMLGARFLVVQGEFPPGEGESPYFSTRDS